jgi:2-dehydropantoate 2-reductase
VRFVIYGAGGVGGTIGGRLHVKGFDTVLVARGAHGEALKRSGMRFSDPAWSGTLRIPTVEDPSELEWSDGDVIILAVKGQDTASAAERIVELAGVDIPVIAAQNGVANERYLLRRFAQVYGMRVSVSASFLEPGSIMCHSAPISGILDIGRYPSGVDGVAREVAEALTTATFSSYALPDIMRWKYRKLLLNLGNATEAVCEPGTDTRSGELATAAREEGIRVLAAAGIDVATEEQDDARIADNLPILPVNGTPHQGSSSWQGLVRGTGSIETDYLNGEIVLLGRLHGCPTPVNEVLQILSNQIARRNDGPGRLSSKEVLDIVARRRNSVTSGSEASTGPATAARSDTRRATYSAERFRSTKRLVQW